MAHNDGFALTTSQLNPFLFAEVGTELNGSALTVLSVLARQGKDAWAEAASWARLPRAGVIESLAGSIATMPLIPQDLAAAPATAARLVLLLPERGQAMGPLNGRSARPLLRGALPKRLPTRLILYMALVIALGLNVFFAHQSPPAAAAPTAQVAQPAPMAQPAPGAISQPQPQPQPSPR